MIKLSIDLIEDLLDSLDGDVLFVGRLISDKYNASFICFICIEINKGEPLGLYIIDLYKCVLIAYDLIRSDIYDMFFGSYEQGQIYDVLYGGPRSTEVDGVIHCLYPYPNKGNQVRADELLIYLDSKEWLYMNELYDPHISYMRSLMSSIGYLSRLEHILLTSMYLGYDFSSGESFKSIKEDIERMSKKVNTLISQYTY